MSQLVEEDGDEIFAPIKDARCPIHGKKAKPRDGFWRCPVDDCGVSFGQDFTTKKRTTIVRQSR